MRTLGFTQEITMSRWYQRRAEDIARESSAPPRRPRRRRRKAGANARWHPRLDAPCMPPYLPDLRATVLVRLREGTVDQFEEVHGHIVGRAEHPNLNLAYLEVQNCTRKVRLAWHGCEWKCTHDRFYYEVDLRPESESAVA